VTRTVAALSANAWPLAVAAGAFALAVGLPAGDADMWWHLASGRWMVERGEGLRVDVFSSTATGEPYALGEWLGDVALYGAYAAAGWTGVATARAALVALAAFAVTRLALRSAPARAAIPVAMLALLLSKPLWTDRPQLCTLALFPLVLELCFAARASSRAALVATVPVIALWANVHSGYALGIAALWVFALEAVLERRPAAAPLAAAVVATAVVSALPGPLSLLRALGHVAGSVIRVPEELPVDPLTPFGMLFALFLGATLLALMLRGAGTHRADGAPLLGAMVTIPMLLLALTAQKHVPLFAFAAVPFVVGPLSALADEVGTTLRRGGTTLRRGGFRHVALAGARSGPFASGSPGIRHRNGDDRHWIDDEDRQAAAEQPVRSGMPDGSESDGTTSRWRTTERNERSRSESDADAGPKGAGVGGPLDGVYVDPYQAGTDPYRPGTETHTPPAKTPSGLSDNAAPRPPSKSFPLALAGALWLGALASIAIADPRPDLAPYPTGAVAALETSSGILLNELDWGGYLIWTVPSRAVFVDGRVYPFAGNSVMRSYQQAVHVLPAWRAVIERWDVSQALLRPRRALVQALRDEGWSVRAQDAGFVLLERPR
jgi:hypothetical protein